MNNRYNRPEVKQVTKQWVKENCKNVTERDLELLKVIHQHRILRRDQIQRLYPRFPSTDFLNKRLKMLYDKHIIDRVYPPVGIGKGSSKQHVCLDRAGVILLGLDSYNKPISYHKGQKILPLGWEHRVALNEYECRIREFCRSIGARVVYYKTEKPYAYNDTRIIPDITCVISHMNKGYSFFIEVDLGTEDLPYLKKKIDSYMSYKVSNQWHKEKWSRVFKSPKFPKVLVFTEDGRIKRQLSLQEYAKDVPIKSGIDFHGNLENIMKMIIKG